MSQSLLPSSFNIMNLSERPGAGKAEAAAARERSRLFRLVVVSSRVGFRIPHTTGRITVSDTFILLALLLYGGEAAALLAVAEGVCSSLRINLRPLTVVFNGAVMGCATYATAC